jgi:hypothetical protein
MLKEDKLSFLFVNILKSFTTANEYRNGWAIFRQRRMNRNS